MGRRLLTVTQLNFHEKRKKDEIREPHDLNGEDLLDIFESWLKEFPRNGPEDDDDSTWFQIKQCKRFAPRVCLSHLIVGFFGEEGEVIDTNTGESVHKISDTDAPTGENRVMLFVPERGDSAYFLSEESNRGNGGAKLLRQFKKYFSERYGKVTMIAKKVTESESWYKAAKLKEIEVRTEGKAVDIADGKQIEIGKLSYVIKPKKGIPWGLHILNPFRKKEVVGKVIGVNSLPDEHNVHVTLEYQGRQKKFILGDNEAAPYLREVLNDISEPTLTDEELVKRSTERVSELHARVGQEWDKKWSEPNVKHGLPNSSQALLSS